MTTFGYFTRSPCLLSSDRVKSLKIFQMSPVWQLFSGLLGGLQPAILILRIWSAFNHYFPQKQTFSWFIFSFPFPQFFVLFCCVCCCCYHCFIFFLTYLFIYLFISASISGPGLEACFETVLVCSSSGPKSAVDALQRAWNPRGRYCCLLGDFCKSWAPAEPRWMRWAFRMGCHQSASFGAWQHLSSEHCQ